MRPPCGPQSGASLSTSERGLRGVRSPWGPGLLGRLLPLAVRPCRRRALPAAAPLCLESYVRPRNMARFFVLFCFVCPGIIFRMSLEAKSTSGSDENVSTLGAGTAHLRTCVPAVRAAARRERGLGDVPSGGMTARRACAEGRAASAPGATCLHRDRARATGSLVVNPRPASPPPPSFAGRVQTFLAQECHEILHYLRPSSAARVYKEFQKKGERMTKNTSREPPSLP